MSALKKMSKLLTGTHGSDEKKRTVEYKQDNLQCESNHSLTINKYEVLFLTWKSKREETKVGHASKHTFLTLWEVISPFRGSMFESLCGQHTF